MTENICMYTTQGEMKCCEKNDMSCYYDLPKSVQKHHNIKTVDETKSYPPAIKSKPSLVKSKPIVIDEMNLKEKFTMRGPLHEYFENDPKGLMSGFISTCQPIE